MKLTINGEQVDVADSARTVADVKAHFELSDKVVIVELNGEILEKDQHETAQVQDGDKLEMVHFVGGG